MILDQLPFGGDQSQYGNEAIRLYKALNEPAEWWAYMTQVMLYKPPGVVWLAQFFVPLWHLFDSIDMALYLCILFIHFLGLIFLFSSCLKVSMGRLPVAVLGCLIAGSAPLFIGMSHELMNEPLQFLVVSYFVFIMVSVRELDRASTLSHLLLGSALAVLAKTTTPLFCLGPALLGLFWVLRRHRSWGWKRPGTIIISFCGLLLSVAVIAWYRENFAAVRAFVLAATVGSAAEYWGKQDTILNSLFYWISTAQQNFLILPVALLSLAFVSAGTFKGVRSRDYFTTCVGIAILQIATVFVVFSTQTNRSPRFLLPLLPYVCLLICWSVVQIQTRRVIYASLGVFIFQFIVVHLNAFDVKWYRVQSFYLRAIHPNKVQGELLNEIVSRTCNIDYPVGRKNIVGIDPNLKGDWLGPDGLNYLTAKKGVMEGVLFPCYYVYLGASIFGADAGDAWRHTIASRPEYVIAINPEVYALNANVYNRTLSPQNFPVYFRTLTTSKIFKLLAPLTTDAGILLFHRMNQLKLGIMLVEIGENRAAIEELKEATMLHPRNDQGWLYLALASERAGKLRIARPAANKALELLSNDDENISRRIAVLSILTRINIREKKIDQACRVLLDISQLEPTAPILGDLQSLNCTSTPGPEN